MDELKTYVLRKREENETITFHEYPKAHKVPLVK
jgi:hypothetical protein